jgi:hypothetical protein
LRKLASLLLQVFVVAVALTILFVTGMFLLGILMMGGNFGGMYMAMGQGMLMAMLWPSTLVAVVAAAIGVAVYNLLVPKIDSTKITEAPPVNYREAVLRLLKDDERQVVQALTRSGGTEFQRDLQRATGFSKVKTHRVIARLAERRLVEVTPAGKTNQIRIPSWLIENRKNSNDQEIRK